MVTGGDSPLRNILPGHLPMRRPIFLALLLPALLLLAAAFNFALAQEQEPPTAKLQRELARIEAGIAEHSANDERLVALRVETDKLAKSLIDFGVSFRPELGRINARLEELGPAPKEGEPAEPDIVVAERKELASRKAAINAELAAAERLSIRTNEASAAISDLRRELFANTLFRRTTANGVFSAENWKAFRDDIYKAWRTIASRLQFVGTFRMQSLLIAGGLSIALVLAVWWGFQRTLGRMLLMRQRDGELSYFGRLSLAFWSTVVPTLAFCVGLGIVYWLFFTFAIFSGQSLELFQAFLVSVAAFFFIQQLVRSIFAPGHPGRRLAAVTDRGARWIVALTLAMAAVHILDFMFGWIADIYSSSLAVTVGQSMVAALTIGVLLIMIALVKPYRDAQTGQPLPLPGVVRIPMLLLAAFVIIAAVSGYVGLAKFAAAQIVITGAILATMLIGLQTGRALGADGALDATRLGARLKARFELSDTAMDQFGLLLSLGTYLMVVLVGVPLIALQWGFNRIDVSSFLYRIMTNITIGSFSISLFAILFGIILFVLGYVLTRQFQAWLDRNVMARSRLDTGVRNSIRTIAGYIGIGLAALVGVSAAGFDLSNLAIVAGALSLGIGFGLQNIVNNFVSGLILLAERPFKVGDWIVAGQTAGTVKRISVRATEIETFQKQTVILPNSELINQPVGNWTHRNHLGRVDVAVTVAYGTNPRMVHDLLLEIAGADPSVLKVPAPFVVFLGFGELALNFELRFHVKDVLEGSVIATRIRFAIVDAFEAKNIQIPFPQRDLNIKTEDLEKLLSSWAEKSESKQPAARARAKPARS